MKILIVSDVHSRKNVSERKQKKTVAGVKRVIEATPCDLIVFLGDVVHGPDFKKDDGDYEAHLREVLDLTGNTPFAFVFGNHDDECAVTKEEILSIIASYPNSLTKGKNYVLHMQGETLLFIDSGSYNENGGYDVVRQEVIDFAKEEIKGKKAVLFQHIIVPDIMNCVADGRKARFKKDVLYIGRLGETPCPPNENTGELEQLSPYLKGAVFGHDHKNTFELQLKGVRIIQCGGCGYNSYEKLCRRSVKLLDTKTMTSELIYI